MARALGLGGVFLKCPDQQALTAWYRDHLGFDLQAFGGTVFTPDQLPAGAYTVWSTFAEDSDYFHPSGAPFMINLIVDDVEAALLQVEAGGASRVGEVEDSEYGRFGWFIDPAGIKIELWQPAAPPKE